MNMQGLKKFSAGLVAVVGLLGGGAASATQICNGCIYNDLGPGLRTINEANVFGTYNPTTFDNGSFTHGGLGAGSFDDWAVFTISPAGQVQATATFVFDNRISGFHAQIYEATLNTCGAFVNGGLMANCSSVTQGALIFDTGILGAGANQFTTPLLNLGGSYAINIGGNVSAGPSGNRYDFNLSTLPSAIPEPGSLALAALALLGAGAVARRRS